MVRILALGVIVAHLLGDYVLQNSWMAKRKLQSLWMAWWHGWIHGVLLMLVVHFLYPEVSEWKQLTIFAVTAVTHAAIDRWRLVKPLIWLLNQASPERYSWIEGKRNNGHSMNTPAWMSTWLMFIADNGLHLAVTFVLLISLGVGV